MCDVFTAFVEMRSSQLGSRLASWAPPNTFISQIYPLRSSNCFECMRNEKLHRAKYGRCVSILFGRPKRMWNKTNEFWISFYIHFTFKVKQFSELFLLSFSKITYICMWNSSFRWGAQFVWLLFTKCESIYIELDSEGRRVDVVRCAGTCIRSQKWKRKKNTF